MTIGVTDYRHALILVQFHGTEPLYVAGSRGHHCECCESIFLSTNSTLRSTALILFKVLPAMIGATGMIPEPKSKYDIHKTTNGQKLTSETAAG